MGIKVAILVGSTVVAVSGCAAAVPTLPESLLATPTIAPTPTITAAPSAAPITGVQDEPIVIDSIGTVRVGTVREVDRGEPPPGFRFVSVALTVAPTSDSVLDVAELATRAVGGYAALDAKHKGELAVPLELKKGSTTKGALVFRIPVGGDYALRLRFSTGVTLEVILAPAAGPSLKAAAAAYLKLVTANNKKVTKGDDMLMDAGCSERKLGKAYAYMASTDQEFRSGLAKISFPDDLESLIRALDRNTAAQITVERQLAGNPLDYTFRSRLRRLVDAKADLAPRVREALGLPPLIAKDDSRYNACSF